MLKRLLTGLIWSLAVFGLACNNSSSKTGGENRRKIADKTDLSADWLEISPVPSLEVTDKIYFIGLKIKDLKGWADKENTTLELNDGSRLKIEVELTDEKGNQIKLFSNGIADAFVEFGKRAQNKENIEESYFQKGEKFNKVRIRSDKPVTTEEIVWARFEF